MRLRPRKPVTYVCGMFPDRCAPPPTRTACSGGFSSAGTSLPSVLCSSLPNRANRVFCSNLQTGRAGAASRVGLDPSGRWVAIRARRGCRVTQTITEHSNVSIPAICDELLLGNCSTVLLSRLEHWERTLSAPGGPHRKIGFYFTLCDFWFPSFKTGLTYFPLPAYFSR